MHTPTASHILLAQAHTNRFAQLCSKGLLSMAVAGCLSLAFLSTTVAADFSGSLKGVSITDAQATNKPPTAAFTYSINGNTVFFDASGSLDSDGTILEYRWDFGDGSGGTGKTIQHTFTTLQPSSITLTVIDDKKAVALLQNKITQQKYFLDTFSEPTATSLSLHTPESGEKWIIPTGSSYSVDPVIKLWRTVDTTVPLLAYADYAPPVSNYKVTAIVKFALLTWGNMAGPCVRIDSNLNGYCGVLSGDSNLMIKKFINGSGTTIKTVPGLKLTANKEYKISIMASDNVINYDLYTDTTLVTSGSVSDSTSEDIGHPGVTTSGRGARITTIITE